MKKIVEINGVSVFSDKTLKSTNNNIVTFSDYSWCDVSTGKVENKGDGEILLKGQFKNNGDNNLSIEL